MVTALRPWRSALYVPASRARALVKAQDLPADAIIFDLEDAVAPEDKPGARDLLQRTIPATDYGPRMLIVRINGLATPWGADDAAALADLPVHGLLIPKAGSAEDIEAVARLAPALPLWAMIETAAGVLNAAAIAAHPRIAGLVMGTNDLLAELGARPRADRLALLPAFGLAILAARAAGRIILDGVYNAFRDEAGFRAECDAGRDLGFDGKTLIHPDQLAIANAVFAPSAEDVDLARRQIAAFDAARRRGQGLAVLDGRIVETLHVAGAKAMLARAEAIAALPE